MFVRSTLVAVAMSLAQAVPDVMIVTGTAIDTSCNRVYHSPGPLERLEGVWYRWIDNSGFVQCKTSAECRRFLDLDSLDIHLSDAALTHLDELERRFPDYWGVYRIRFVGRRGAVVLPTSCFDHSLPDVPAYVRVERMLSIERLKDLSDK